MYSECRLKKGHLYLSHFSDRASEFYATFALTGTQNWSAVALNLLPRWQSPQSCSRKSLAGSAQGVSALLLRERQCATTLRRFEK